MSVKIPPMSPTATFEISGADLKAIVTEEVTRKLSAIYGDVAVTVRFCGLTAHGDHDLKAGTVTRDDDVVARVEFIVKPKLTRGE